MRSYLCLEIINTYQWSALFLYKTAGKIVSQILKLLASQKENKIMSSSTV